MIDKFRSDTTMMTATDHHQKPTNLSHDAISKEIIMQNAAKIKITKVDICM